MSDLMVYCNCLKKAFYKLDPQFITTIKFDSNGSSFIENDQFQSDYIELLNRYCSHEVKSIAIFISLPKNLPTLLYYIEVELSESIENLKLLSREFLFAGNSKGSIEVNELSDFKSEIGLLWNNWEDKLNLDKEVEELLINFETCIQTANEMNNPILIL